MPTPADSYFTLRTEATAQFVEQRSRFIAFAAPLSHEEAIQEYLKQLRRKYHDARHICYAYRLQSGAQRANDDGEPSGTAGRPILGRLESAGATDALVAVVRYFGGVKLGTSGLILAYRQAAQMAIEAAGLIEKPLGRMLTCRFAYERMNSVMQCVRAQQMQVEGQDYEGVLCVLRLVVRPSRFDEACEQLLQLHGVQLIEP